MIASNITKTTTMMMMMMMKSSIRLIILVVLWANLLLAVVAFSPVSKRSPKAAALFDTQGSAATSSSNANPRVAKNYEQKEDDFVTMDFHQRDPSTELPITMESTWGNEDTDPRRDESSLLYPLDLVVDHNLVKHAVLLAAVLPSNTLIISGVTGSCKSVLARSVQRLMKRHETTIHVPVTVTADAIQGSVDIEKSLETGTAVFEPGLLFKAHENILLVDDINLLDQSVASILLNDALQDGKVRVEREGLSVEYPCRPAVCVATWNPEYEEMREHHLDRFAMHVSTDILLEQNEALSIQDRVQGVLNVEAFVDRNVEGAPEQNQRQFRLEQAFEMESVHIEQVEQARKLLPHVELSHDQIMYLCQQATAWDCPGQRAEISAAQVARSAAALDGRTAVQAADLELAVKLCIVPRGRVVWLEEAEEVGPMEERKAPPLPAPETQPLPAPPDMMKEDLEKDEQVEEPSDSDETEENPEEESLAVPEELFFSADTSVKIDPELLQFQKYSLGKGRRGGKRHRRFNLQRGRFVKAIFPKGSEGRLAVGATLRAAAPYQKLRRQRIHRPKMTVLVTKDDFRIQQLKKKTGSLIIFVVDASGSMALNRMAAAKGAAMTLLHEAYKSRDKIALVAFSGKEAEVVVPPTKSVALTRRRLESMPCGSQTPLADALVKAVRIGVNAIKVKQDTGKVALVLISDCRPNVPLCVSEGETFDANIDPRSTDGQPSRQYLKDEVVAIGKQIGVMNDFDLLCIDTEDKFVHTGVAEELTRVAGGNYHALPRADHRSISRVVSEVTATT